MKNIINSNEKIDSRNNYNKGKVVACTSVAANYIPMARILCTSIKKYHPEWHIVLILSDDLPDWFDVSREPFDEVLPLSSMDIGLQSGWIFSHDIEELCTAVKPFAMNYLLSRPYVSTCLYFDPDMVLFDRLDDLLENFCDYDVLLTPHQTVPEPTRAGVIDNEIGSLRHGIYNLGFLGILNTQNGRNVVKYWEDRIYDFCLARVDLSIWTDQKWFNHVPVFFDGVKVLRSPRYNVAPWNLSTRKIESSIDNKYYVNGLPLGFYHFSGFNSGDHAVQAARFSQDFKCITKLLDWYTSALKIEGAKHKKKEWIYSRYNNGDEIRLVHRLIYRYRADLQKSFPDPFDSIGYLSWLNKQGRIEYGDLVDFVENRQLDIPKMPDVGWLKSFPPAFSHDQFSPPSVKAFAHDNNISANGRFSLYRLSKLIKEFLFSSDRRHTLSRVLIGTYRAKGVSGIIAKLKVSK